MESAALLLAVAGGFVFSSYFRFTQLRIAQSTGYELFFLSILSGYGLYQISCLALYPFVLDGWTLQAFFALWLNPIDHGLMMAIPRDLIGSITIWRDNLLSPSLLALLLGTILWAPGNWIVRICLLDSDLYARQVTRHGTELDQMLLQAMVTRQQLLVSLDTGKVYAGSVVKLPKLKRSIDDPSVGFTLLVSRSGYREVESQEVRFTTDYEWIYNEEIDAPSIAIGELETFIPLRRLVSFTLFEPELYDDFQRHGKIDS